MHSTISLRPIIFASFSSHGRNRFWTGQLTDEGINLDSPVIYFPFFLSEQTSLFLIASISDICSLLIASFLFVYFSEVCEF